MHGEHLYRDKIFLYRTKMARRVKFTESPELNKLLLLATACRPDAYATDGDLDYVVETLEARIQCIPVSIGGVRTFVYVVEIPLSGFALEVAGRPSMYFVSVSATKAPVSATEVSPGSEIALNINTSQWDFFPLTEVRNISGSIVWNGTVAPDIMSCSEGGFLIRPPSAPEGYEDEEADAAESGAENPKYFDFSFTAQFIAPSQAFQLEAKPDAV